MFWLKIIDTQKFRMKKVEHKRVKNGSKHWETNIQEKIDEKILCGNLFRKLSKKGDKMLKVCKKMRVIILYKKLRGKKLETKKRRLKELEPATHNGCCTPEIRCTPSPRPASQSTRPLLLEHPPARRRASSRSPSPGGTPRDAAHRRPPLRGTKLEPPQAWTRGYN
jgi:hypothetical protein